MAVQCPHCGRQYDVTLFEFTRSLGCDCGATLDLASGHTRCLGGARPRPELPPGPEPAPITAATLDYVNAPHIARDYDRYFRYNALFRFDVSLLDRWFQQPGRLLDLGCGTGRHVVHFAARGFEVTGMDLSAHMLAEARRKLHAAGVEATLLRTDIVRLGELVPPCCFDYAICMFSTLGMIYGAGNRLRFLESVRRCLVPGGAFALHVHNRWHNLWNAEGRRYLRRALRAAWRGEPEAFQKDMDGYRGIRGLSVYVYGARELRRVVRRAGFRVERFVHLNDARNAELRGPCRALRSNGFVLLCRAAQAPGGTEARGS